MDTEPKPATDIQATEVEEEQPRGLLNSSDPGDDINPITDEPEHSEGQDSEHGSRRHSADGKLRGKSTSSTVKGGASTGSSRPSGPKNDSDASVSPQEDVDVKEDDAAAVKEEDVNKTAEEPAPPKKRGKLRGRANPNDAKGGSSGGPGGMPKGPKH